MNTEGHGKNQRINFHRESAKDETDVGVALVGSVFHCGAGSKFFDTEEANKSYDLHGLKPKINPLLSLLYIRVNPWQV